MSRRLAGLAFALALSTPALASAQYHPPQRGDYGPPLEGPTLSAWVGVGIPGGNISGEGDGPLGDVVSRAVPFGLGVGYRFGPLLRAGLLFEGAPLSMDDRACDPGAPCNGSDFRLGVEAQLHLAPFRRVDPWVGLGLGYEWLRFDAVGCDVAGTSCFAERFRYSGWLFPRISAGLDLAVSPLASLGPYVAYSAGQYGNVDTTAGGSQSIQRQSFHGWLELGIRGTLNL
jgi:opacity protein-like surface antigen